MDPFARGLRSLVCVLVVFGSVACSAAPSAAGPHAPGSPAVAGAAAIATTAGQIAAVAGGTAGMAASTRPPQNSAGSVSPSAGKSSTLTAGSPGPGVGVPGSAGTMSNTAGTMATTGATPPMATGPEDGDPAMPVISIPDVACGGPKGAFGSGLANFKIDDRDMIVTYPCNKHAGVPATFILNLHGTTPVEQHFYQHGYFSAHQFTASHNLIIVTPSSVVQQWGNMDMGQDEPHLMKIIDWVYANLNGAGKFDIKSMWVGGHSWGGLFTARFGCKAELADKVKGLIIMSGGNASSAACSSKVAVIVTTAEGDKAMPGDQSSLATSHGCSAAQTQMILNNVHTFWPACKPGFVHANYYMLGKEHATSMDRDVVQSIVNWIKIQRQ